MLLASFVHLRYARPNDVVANLEDLILKLPRYGRMDWDKDALDMRRSLLSILAAEVRWGQAQNQSADASTLAALCARVLATCPRPSARYSELESLSRACSMLGAPTASEEVLSSLVPLSKSGLGEIGAWLDGRRKAWPEQLPAAQLLKHARAFLPHHAGYAVGEMLLSHLADRVTDLRFPELVDFAALVALQRAAAQAEAKSKGKAQKLIVKVAESEWLDADKKRADAIITQMHRHVNAVPIRSLPTLLGATQGLPLPPKANMENITELCERVAGRLIGEIRFAVERWHPDAQNDIIDADGLSDAFYILASRGAAKDELCDAVKQLVLSPLPPDGLALIHRATRNITFVHILHSLTSCKAAEGSSLQVLLEALLPRLQAFDTFEVVGILDALASLQRQQTAKSAPDYSGAAEAVDAMEDAHANGSCDPSLIEEVLQSALARAEALAPEASQEEQRILASLTQAIEVLPDAALTSVDAIQSTAASGQHGS